MPRLRTVATMLALTMPMAAQEKLPAARLLADACNHFAADLQAQLPPTADVALSPASIALALLMLEPGARGETQVELRRALHLPDALQGPQLVQAARALLDATGTDTEGKRPKDTPILRIVDDLWTQRDFAIRPEFTRALRDGFGASHREVDFRATPDQARRRINAHIADMTENRIQDLLTPDLVSPATRTVLTNAMWFRGRWQHPFHTANTQDRPFRLASGETVAVPAMHETATFRYAENAAWQCLSMAFAHGAITCDVMLPKPTQALAQAERDLLLGVHTTLLQPRTVQVQMPRFRIEGSFRLRETLQALGVRAAFAGGLADFRGIREANDVFVDEVVHRAWLAVDEAGAEAAAATAILVKAGSPRPTDFVAFVADRPFVMALRDGNTGLVLFQARVLDPRRAKAATTAPRTHR